jgi:photosystem II stability/assembly factor-like uncharacterized protein
MLAVTRAGERLVAVGERGIVLLSDDGGRNWRQTKTPVRTTLTAVSFVGAKNGWAVGHLGVVLHSADGGETWIKQLDGIEAARLVLAATEKRAANETNPEERDWLLGGAQRLVDDGPDKPFLGLCFLNERSGYIFGAFNLIFRTDDGGASWTPWQAHVDNPSELHLYGMRAIGDKLFIAGEQGLLLRSDDGGEHFATLESPYEGSFFGLVAGSASNILVFGLRGNIYHSGDDGESWQQVDAGIPVSLSAGTRLADGGLAVVSQAGDLLISHDEGHSFALSPDGMPMPATDLVQSTDGGLIIANLRGLRRLEEGAQ